jgi:uncharacterized protein YndB with AHSA1/START domain
MPTFALSARSSAPLEEVWKLLHDPTRYPEWWEGIETVRAQDQDPDGFDYTMWPEGYPDFPMGQRLRVTPAGVTISCLVSDLTFTWQLAATDPGTEIRVEVDIPEREAHRLDSQQRLLQSSLHTLSELAGSH